MLMSGVSGRVKSGIVKSKAGSFKHLIKSHNNLPSKPGLKNSSKNCFRLTHCCPKTDKTSSTPNLTSNCDSSSFKIVDSLILSIGLSMLFDAHLLIGLYSPSELPDTPIVYLTIYASPSFPIPNS